MTGRKLYDRWNFEMAEQGVEVEEWDELADTDRAAWNALAEWVGVQ